jgi:cysteine synthase A
MVRQFENEANPDFHSKTTAQEILRDFQGTKLDYWVTGYGTGGTLKGVSRVLREKSPGTKIIVAEPEDAPLLGSGIAQERNPDGSPSAGHPSFKSHPMQGWTPDFIPKLTQDVVDGKFIDQLLHIPGPEALKNAKDLAKREGIFCGITSGGTFAAALRIAKDAPQGSTILAMLPDTGERYLSTPLFADVGADMNDEEIAISQSTPSAQLPPKQ